MPYHTISEFESDIIGCGADYYSDTPLGTNSVQNAFRIYQNAAGGTKLTDLAGTAVDFGVTIVGRLARRDSDGQWVPSNESFPSIDRIMRENLRVNDEASGQTGSILNASTWSLLANDAWLLGSLHAQTEFHFASPLTWKNLWNEERSILTITGRELIGIVTFGYRIVPTVLEPVAVCEVPECAVAATFLAYRDAVLRHASREAVEHLQREVNLVLRGPRSTAVAAEGTRRTLDPSAQPTSTR